MKTAVELATLGRQLLHQIPVLLGTKDGPAVVAFEALGRFAGAVDEVLGEEANDGTQAGGPQPPAGSQTVESMETPR